MFTQKDIAAAKEFLGIAEQVPGLIGAARDKARDVFKKGARGSRAYERTHGGRMSEPAAIAVLEEGDPGTWIEGFPDPRTGVTEMGRLSAISYITSKGERGETEYQHHFGPRARTRACPECGNHERIGRVDARALPVLGFTFDEHPSGLTVARAESAYKVTSRGIEG